MIELTTEASAIQTTQPPVSTADSGASTISISTFKPDLDSGVSPETAAAWLNMSDFKQGIALTRSCYNTLTIVAWS